MHLSESSGCAARATTCFEISVLFMAVDRRWLNDLISDASSEKNNVTCLRDCSATEWRFASRYDEKLRALRLLQT